MKDEYLQQAAGQTQNCAGSAGIGKPAMHIAEPSMRERLKAQLYHAQKESSKENKLLELEYLLDKNPEVARILELLDQVRS